MNKSDFHGYQNYALDFMLNNKLSALFLGMGLGKTVTILTGIQELIYDRFQVSRALIVAPKRVAEETWPDELEKWEHLQGLTMSVIAGTEQERIIALNKKADIHVIGRDNVVWLVAYLAGAWPWDMMVLDESSSFKNHASKRTEILNLVRPYCDRVVLASGTPSPNGLMDLWSQFYLLDMGERLGRAIGAFRETYFTYDSYTSTYSLRKGLAPQALDHYEKEIYARIADVSISMKSEDYLQLPDRVDIDVPVHLAPGTYGAYKLFEKEKVMELMGTKITAANAMVLTGKLLQFANGAIYDKEKETHEMHKAKLHALEEIIEAANGEPVLVFYSYQHDLDRIMKHFAKYKPRHLQKKQDTKDWNAGKIKLMIAHPASTGHGLNLQYGGHIMVWFGLTFSLELYLQAIARLDRQGQVKPCRMYRLIAKGTADEHVASRLEWKEAEQDDMLLAVKVVEMLVEQYKNVA